MRRPLLPAIAAALVLGLTPALAQTPPPPAPDPVIARIGADEIHASELSEAAQSLPEEVRGLQPAVLYPMLLNQLIDRRAIVIEGRKQGLANDPIVQRQALRATDAAIQNLLLSRAIAPTLTEDAIKARYDQDYTSKPGEEEVHAAHILVDSEEKAKAIIAQLKTGKDFADLARDNSTDPSAKTNNGDLGFFKKDAMLPEFADAAFALKPGEVSPEPIHTRFGYHVIKLLERRTAAPPALAAVHDEIRQELIQDGVAKVLAAAKQGLVVEKFNLDGSPLTDVPPPNAPLNDAPPPPPDVPLPGNPPAPAK